MEKTNVISGVEVIDISAKNFIKTIIQQVNKEYFKKYYTNKK